MGWNCQRCGQPLQLDASLDTATEETVDEAQKTVEASFSNKAPERALDFDERLDTLNVHGNLRDALRTQINTYKQEPQRGVDSLEETSQYSKLFQCFSEIPYGGAQAIQHPLCDTCAEQLHENTLTQINEARKEHDTLNMLERELVRLALLDGDMEMSADDAARWQRKQNAVQREVEDVGRYTDTDRSGESTNRK